MLIYLSMIEDAEDQNKFEQVYLRYKNLMFYVAHRILNLSLIHISEPTRPY